MTAVAAPYVLENGDTRWGMQLAGLHLGLLARSEDTGGQLSLMSYQAPPGFTGPPLHVHRDLDEAMFVVDGTLRVRLGDDEHEVGAGGFVWMPRDVPHAFANSGDDPAHFVGVVCPPGGMEDFFAAARDEFAKSDGPPDPERLMELNARHGIEVLGPPLPARAD